MSKVHLDVKLSRHAGQLLDELKRLQADGEPPKLMLNRHCQVCEFRQRCREEAVKADDISLLGGMSAKEVAILNSKGIFTITQYSHSFRPRRIKRVGEGKPNDPQNAFWFFTTTIGKQTHATVFVDPSDFKFPAFRKEGEFDKYVREKSRRYFIFLCEVDGDTLLGRGGDGMAVKKLRKAGKIDIVGEW